MKTEFRNIKIGRLCKIRGKWGEKTKEGHFELWIDAKQKCEVHDTWKPVDTVNK